MRNAPLALLTVIALVAWLRIVPGGTARAAAHGSVSAASLRGATEGLKDTLVDLERRSWDAWKGHDAAFFQHFLSDDHVEVYGTGPTTKSAVVGGVRSGGCVVSSFAVDSFSMARFDRSAALLTYRAQQETKCGTFAVPSPVWVASLYVLRDGRWQNAFLQQTPVPH